MHAHAFHLETLADSVNLIPLLEIWIIVVHNNYPPFNPNLSVLINLK